jgi:hypothetical protein
MGLVQDIGCGGRRVVSLLNVCVSWIAMASSRYHGDPYPGGVVSPAPRESAIMTENQARDQILRIRSAMLE